LLDQVALSDEDRELLAEIRRNAERLELTADADDAVL
jgi:hypothetical protein